MTQTTAQPVPYFDTSAQNKVLKPDIMAAMERVYDSGSYILGPEVEAFEAEFAAYCGTKHVIAVNSGTSAVHLGLQVLGIQPGDEVITTPFTFAASAWGISYCGAKPVFVDVQEDTFNIDPSAVEKAITSKTKAIVPVHLYGHPCDMDPLMDLCNTHGLQLMEDAAQAHGAQYKGRKIGTIGNTAAYSFFPTKNLGACGEAGAVVTDDDNLAAHLRSLRNHGSTKRYHYDEVGYNYRIEAMQAAILRVKLKHLDEHNRHRLWVVSQYEELLGDVAGITLPAQAPYAESVYHLYSIRATQREKLCEHLQKEAIGYSNHYPIPLHLQKCYKDLGYAEGSLPVTEHLSQEIVNLPIFPGITEAQIKRVASVVKSFYA